MRYCEGTKKIACEAHSSQQKRTAKRASGSMHAMGVAMGEAGSVVGGRAMGRWGDGMA